MAEGADRAHWDRAALLWHIGAEPNRDRQQTSQPFSPADVHPYRNRAWYDEPNNSGQTEAMVRRLAAQQEADRGSKS